MERHGPRCRKKCFPRLPKAEVLALESPRAAARSAKEKMMRSMTKRCGLLVAAFLMACGGGNEESAEELPDVDCSGTIPTFSQVTAFVTCVNCHTSTAIDREDAPEGIDFDTYAAAKAHAEDAAAEVFEGAMPPSPYELNASEKQNLYLWALCGTPE